ncbi:LptF/LptG family permease [Thermodesulfovibrio hydrogeniphilus]
MVINTFIKLYLKEFLKVFLILILSLSSLLAITGLIEKIDEFVPYNPPTSFFFQYAVLSIPRYLFYLIPFVTLITSLFIFSMGVRNREFLIISASGGKLRNLLKPFLLLGIIIAIFGFIFGEFIQPEFTKKLNSMIEQLSAKGKAQLEKDIFLKTKDGSVVKIGSFSEKERLAMNVKIFVIQNNALVKTVEAQYAEIKENDTWKLKNVSVYDYEKGKQEKLETMNYPIKAKISAVAFKDIKKIDEFGIAELLQKRKELKRVGLSNPKIDTDISGRLSYNFVTFFMMILGISLPLGAYEKFIFLFSKTKDSRGASGAITVGIGLLITVFYWVVYSIFMVIGYSKILPPFVAPWITPLIFGLISIKLYYSIRE